MSGNDGKDAGADRLIDSRAGLDDGTETEETLRPARLADFVGQETLRANLAVFIDAARKRGEALDHVLLPMAG